MSDRLISYVRKTSIAFFAMLPPTLAVLGVSGFIVPEHWLSALADNPPSPRPATKAHRHIKDWAHLIVDVKAILPKARAVLKGDCERLIGARALDRAASAFKPVEGAVSFPWRVAEVVPDKYGVPTNEVRFGLDYYTEIEQRRIEAVAHEMLHIAMKLGDVEAVEELGRRLQRSIRGNHREASAALDDFLFKKGCRIQ